MALSCCWQVLWIRRLCKKWLNMNEVEYFSADENDDQQEDSPLFVDDFDNESSANGDMGRSIPSVNDNLQPYQVTPSGTESCVMEELRITVYTWNVGGRAPRPDLELTECLGFSPSADIYVFGFQEIVPLNASNIFSGEDNGPAVVWQGIIREALNASKSTDFVSSSKEQASVTIVDGSNIQIQTAERNAVNHLIETGTEFQWSPGNTLREGEELVAPLLPSMSKSPYSVTDTMKCRSCYIKIASKQMVGIHISVWIHGRLQHHVRNVSVSCVGLGLMGSLGNKGSISVSMTLNKTTFCFVCAHLSSGDKYGDENKRNSDVKEIIERTLFPPAKAVPVKVPRTILEHDRIIWFGDLNYRLDLIDDKIRDLIDKRDWEALLKKDQLRTQLLDGNVFDGWQEGVISFAPTYKYVFNSTEYAGGKRRSPAWCDRIIWYGKGFRQHLYTRGESSFSDHRPVLAGFLTDVEIAVGSGSH